MSPAFSRDSKRVLVSAEESVYSLALDGSGIVEIVGGPTLGTETPAISWDGTLAIFAQWNGGGEGLSAIQLRRLRADHAELREPNGARRGATPIAYRKPTWSSTGGVAFEEVNGDVASLAVLSGSTAIERVRRSHRRPQSRVGPPHGAGVRWRGNGHLPATCTVGVGMYDCGSKTFCNCPSGVPAQVPVTCEGPASAQKGRSPRYWPGRRLDDSASCLLQLIALPPAAPCTRSGPQDRARTPIYGGIRRRARARRHRCRSRRRASRAWRRSPRSGRADLEPGDVLIQRGDARLELQERVPRARGPAPEAP